MCRYRLVQFSCPCLWGAEYVIYCPKPLEQRLTSQGYTACRWRSAHPDMRRMWFKCWFCVKRSYADSGKELPITYHYWDELVAYMLRCETGQAWQYSMHVMNGWWRIRHIESARRNITPAEDEEVRRRTGYREVVRRRFGF